MAGIFSRIKNLIFGSKEEVEIIKKDDSIIQVDNHKTQNLGHLKSEEIHEEGEVFEDIWNHIDPSKNTQAHHVLSVISFNEWTDMEEIRARIKQMFFIEYKNEKSLYPYIKTLTDIGLLETTSVGGKRKWKKKEIVIRIKPRSLIKLQNTNYIKSLGK